jgi:hypothetical protein
MQFAEAFPDEEIVATLSRQWGLGSNGTVNRLKVPFHCARGGTMLSPLGADYWELTGRRRSYRNPRNWKLLIKVEE